MTKLPIRIYEMVLKKQWIMFWVANIYFPMLCFVPIKNSVTSLTLKDREKENTSYNPNETTVNTLLNFMQPFCFPCF